MIYKNQTLSFFFQPTEFTFRSTKTLAAKEKSKTSTYQSTSSKSFFFTKKNMSYLFLKTSDWITPFLFKPKLVECVDDEEMAVIRYLMDRRKNVLNNTKIKTKNMTRNEKQVRKLNLRNDRRSKSSTANNQLLIPISTCGEHLTFVLIHWHRLVSKKLTDWRPVFAAQFEKNIVKHTLWTIFVKTLSSLAEVKIPIKNLEAIQKYALTRTSLEMFSAAPKTKKEIQEKLSQDMKEDKNRKRRARDLVRLWCFFDRELLKKPPQ